MGVDLFIGVDGGGSKCRARLRDGAGPALGEGLGGPANIWRDPAGAMRSILEAGRGAAEAAGVPDSALARAHVGCGLAGAGQPSAVARFLAEPHPFAAISIETDAFAAWLGAFGGKDGGILIVGTGSCGLAVVGGERTYVGGSGAEISDEGSGAAIGRDAVRRALWAQDGRAPMSGLAAAVLAGFAGGRQSVVDWARTAKPADYARLAPLVFEHAGRGDPLAVVLIEAAAAEIARIGRRLLELGAPPLAIIGGLAEPIRPWLPPDLSARMVPPLADAMDGAIMLAQRARGAAREAGKRKRA
ncbi:MAG TPA: BadF/BadG/BcrA/BcrD ATPase family protein [Alphaproteobacteria bacterium]